MNTQQQQREEIQQVVPYQFINQPLNYLPDMNNTVTMTVSPGPDDLDIGTFFNQYFPSTSEFQEPAQPSTMDTDKQNIDGFLKELELLMERNTIDQQQTEGSSTHAIQQPIEQHNQEEQQVITSDVDSEEEFTSESDEDKIDRQNEESGYVSVAHLRDIHQSVTRIIYNSDYHNNMHNKFTINRLRAFDHKYILFIGNWAKGMDFPYKENDLMSQPGSNCTVQESRVPSTN